MLNFDLEANGLLDTIHIIHCMAIGDGKGNVTPYRPHEVLEAIERLQKAIDTDEPISGHNIINFDTVAINKVHKDSLVIPRDKRHLVVDTLVLARLIYSNIGDLDAPLLRKNALDRKLYKSHSLKAWGQRLGKLKIEFAKHVEDDVDEWAVFTEEMMTYNVGDVEVDEVLLERLNAKGYSPMAIQLEHEVAWLMAQMVRNGFPFDVEKAQCLEMTLRGRLSDINCKLMDQVPPIPDKPFVPKRDNKRLGYIAGVSVPRFKTFNANSRQQIEWIVTKYFGYQPDCLDVYNLPDDIDKNMYDCIDVSTGKYPLKIDDDTFTFISEDPLCPEELKPLAILFKDYLMVSKRLGQLADGKQAWLKSIGSDGNIHGSINPNGAVTGRATHSSPNIGQVPAKGKEYWEECRTCFTVPMGWVQVGVDVSGLELRVLAHYMSPFDEGSYADIVLHGDIHKANQESAGLPTRDMAKTFIYGYLYGAGDAKIGKIVNGTKADGARLKKSFLKKTPALASLKATIEATLASVMKHGRVLKWNRKWLRGLDGRQLHIRSLHSALNTLLQGGGAVICKKWICLMDDMMYAKGYKHGWDGDYCLMAWIHDETQTACRTLKIAEDLLEIAQLAIRETQKFFGITVQLDVEGKIGKNWAECH